MLELFIAIWNCNLPISIWNITYSIQRVLEIGLCDSTYWKVPVVGRLDLELWGCKVKMSQNIVPKLILRSKIFNTQSFSYLKDLEWKQRFHVETGPLNCHLKIPILCKDSQFFWKSTFHQFVMTSSMKLPYLENTTSDFKIFCTKI